MEAAQAEVFAFLARPHSWPGRPDRVEMIDTHGARVFLAGDDVLKVKRAVRLPYLDFSTLEARHHYCAREIALNSRGAPGLYRDVVAITREGSGAFAIGGHGEPVEWAVRMHRFSQDDLLKTVVHRGPLSLELADALADAVWRYHESSPRAPACAENVARVAADLLKALDRFDGSGVGEQLGDLRERVTARLMATEELRTKRAEAGFVRRCHGDLHTGNIVLWHGKPVLFDALEFDEALATTDTLYDLAFLLMDLDRQGVRETANAVLNRYLWRSRSLADLEGLALLPLFIALRAAVRALVTFDRLSADALHGGTLIAQAQSALSLALKDIAPTAPSLVAIGGLSGTGKTTLARALAPSIGAAPGAFHVRTDMERKAMADIEPTERLPQSAYTKETSAAVYARTFSRARAALAAGHAVILDAVFADASERQEAEAIAHAARVPFTGIWLEGDEEALKARVTKRTGDASDATASVVAKQMTYDTGVISWNRIEASGDIASTIAAARELLPL